MRKSLLITEAFLIAALLAGCAPGLTAQKPADGVGSAPSQGALTPTPKSAQETPKYGGVLVAFSSANPPSLDIQQEPTILTAMLVAPAYDSLLQYDPMNGRDIVGGVAESWEVSKDGLTWAFRMRKGVKFHDGKPLTADDVIYNLERIVSPPKGIRSNLAYMLTAVTKIELAGPDAVAVSLKHGYAPLAPTLAQDCSGIFPKHVLLEKGDMQTTAV